MQKSRIEVKANITARTDARKTARLGVDNWRNEITDMADSDGEAKIDLTNMRLAKFSIHTKMFFADS